MNPFNYRLTMAHSRVDEEIRREQKRSVPNSLRLLRLKKLKLAVKDRMHSLVAFRRRGVA